jgi:hypothetical protein
LEILQFFMLEEYFINYAYRDLPIQMV